MLYNLCINELSTFGGFSAVGKAELRLFIIFCFSSDKIYSLVENLEVSAISS